MSTRGRKHEPPTGAGRDRNAAPVTSDLPPWAALVVGPPSSKRWLVTQSLLQQGRPVLLCSGGPTCPLERGESCVLLDCAVVTIGVPDDPDAAESQRLARCLKASPYAFAMGELDENFPKGTMIRRPPPGRAGAQPEAEAEDGG